jgi:hypothetical protein
MKKSAFFSFAVLFACLSGSVSGYNYLTVGDPRSSWWTDQGTIEQAEIYARPKGIYMEFDLYLTFSARNSYFSATDTLEVVLDFELPQEAIVHDSWLWFGEDTLRAHILDKWTATSIYEGVVNRRRDPSILQKLYDNQYELRIFPMAGDKTRKVKISFMLPARWDKDKVSAVVLSDLLLTSRTPVEKLSVITFADDTWKNPVLQGATGVSFTPKNTPALGAHYKAEIGMADFSNRISIAFTSPAKNGVYLSKYESGTEGIYQMALLPSAFVQPATGQKVAVLFDCDISNTDLTTTRIIQQTRDLLLQNLSPQDSFNLFFSNISIVQGNSWFRSDSLTITNVFKNLVNPLSSYSNIPSLISAGINFIKTHGNKGKLVLISNSDQYGNNQVANRLLNDIMELMDPIFPFYIADYNNSYDSYYYINGRYYYGNEYFFSNLSKFTNGSYDRVLDGKSFTEVVDNSLKYMSGSIKSFDLYTKLSNGICYGRYNLSAGSDIVYLNSPILQVGKYKGDFPFEIDYSGEFDSEIISEEITVEEAGILPSDSLLEAIWAGIYIRHMEKQTQTNDVITEIIQNSLSERVLSQYTAFLCIEEALLPCEDCEEPSTTAVPDVKLPLQDILKAYPNPFSGSVTITINLGENNTEKVVQAGIYSVTGELVFMPDLDASQSQQEFELYWDGRDKEGNPMPAGVYIFVLQTDNNVYQVKLIKQ